MFFLIATILLNVVVFSILKLYTRYGINALQAISVNYCVCVVTGCVFTGQMPFTTTTLHSSWFPWALLMGLAFITIFNLTAYCTHAAGMATTVIASKLSLVIAVIASMLLYNEHIGMIKLLGIVLAIPAVYFSTKTKAESTVPQNWFWPVLLFIISGGLDTLVNYVQATYLPTTEMQAAATIVCFATAGILGSIIATVLLISGRIKFEWKNVIAGVCVGIPNFFSIFFLVRTLNSNIFQSSATIPVLNISILLASSLTAIFLFKEYSGKWRIIGLVLSLLAILLIGYGDK